MANFNVSSLAVFDNNQQPINFVEQNGEIFFTSEEVGKHLGYSDPDLAPQNWSIL